MGDAFIFVEVAPPGWPHGVEMRNPERRGGTFPTGGTVPNTVEFSCSFFLLLLLLGFLSRSRSRKKEQENSTVLGTAPG